MYMLSYTQKKKIFQLRRCAMLLPSPKSPQNKRRQHQTILSRVKWNGVELSWSKVASDSGVAVYSRLCIRK